MKKRWIASAMTLCMALSLAPAASALSTERTTVEAVALAALGIMEGDEKGELNLSKTVTRAEFAKMVVAATTTGEVTESRISPYYDVPASHWAAGYVAAARDAGLVRGYLDGLYHPNDTIALEEGATVLLRLLGYSDNSLTGSYPAAQLAKFHSLGLDEGVTAQRGQALTRFDCQQMLYNLLTTATTTGQPYLTTLGYSVTAQGTIDLSQLIAQAMTGPELAQSNWKSQIPFALENAVVYRNGKLTTADQIASGDVLYWAESMRTVWAYRSRVTGTITAVSPGVSAPTAVTVAGQTYTLGSAEAVLQLSDLGSFRKGDTVTLLLGRDDAVTAVKRADTSEDTLGVVTAIETTQTVDGNGNAYQREMAVILASDGNSYSYPVETDHLSKGDCVQICVQGDSFRATKLSRKTLSGEVSADGTTIGGKKLASDVQIVDAAGGQGGAVSASRLAGMSLKKNDVLYYTTNAQGEIDRLLLNDCTGDFYRYGILTDVTDLAPTSQTIWMQYSYLDHGQSCVSAQSGVSYAVKEKQGIRISAKGLFALTSMKLTAVNDDGTASANGERYALADTVEVYEQRDGAFYLSSLERVQEGDFQLTGWYDALPEQGGRIRVIVAR